MLSNSRPTCRPQSAFISPRQGPSHRAFVWLLVDRDDGLGTLPTAEVSEIGHGRVGLEVVHELPSQVCLRQRCPGSDQIQPDFGRLRCDADLHSLGHQRASPPASRATDSERNAGHVVRPRRQNATDCGSVGDALVREPGPEAGALTGLAWALLRQQHGCRWGSCGDVLPRGPHPNRHIAHAALAHTARTR